MPSLPWMCPCFQVMRLQHHKLSAVPVENLPCLSAAERQNNIEADRYNVSTKAPAGQIPCYDPATMQMLGFMPAMSKKQVSSTGRAGCSMPACPFHDLSAPCAPQVQDSVEKARAASQVCLASSHVSLHDLLSACKQLTTKIAAGVAPQ